MYNFNWRMTEQDWNNLKKGTGNCCGSVLVGSMCIEFIWDEDEYPYTNVFVAGIDSGYGYLEDGTPYDLVDDGIVLNRLLKEESFEDFKKAFEAQLNELCNKYGHWRTWAEQEGNWPWR